MYVFKLQVYMIPDRKAADTHVMHLLILYVTVCQNSGCYLLMTLMLPVGRSTSSNNIGDL